MVYDPEVSKLYENVYDDISALVRQKRRDIKNKLVWYAKDNNLLSRASRLQIIIDELRTLKELEAMPNYVIDLGMDMGDIYDTRD